MTAEELASLRAEVEQLKERVRELEASASRPGQMQSAEHRGSRRWVVAAIVSLSLACGAFAWDCVRMWNFADPLFTRYGELLGLVGVGAAVIGLGCWVAKCFAQDSSAEN